MATLTANSKRNFEFNEDPLYDDVPMIADDIIFEGAAVGEDASTGFARPLVNGDVFLGFAVAKSDNTGGLAGDRTVRVRTKGKVQLDVLTVATVADLNDGVNATDDDVFTLGAGSAIGVVSRYVGSPNATTVIVRFESFANRSLAGA